MSRMGGPDGAASNEAFEAAQRALKTDAGAALAGHGGPVRRR